MSTIVEVVAGLVVAWIVLIGILWIVRPRDVGLREVVRLIPDVLRLVRSLLADTSTPKAVRVALVIMIVWLISPIDLIPEFVPVLGPLDDAVVAVLILRFVRRRLGDATLRARWPGTPAGWATLARLLGAAP